MAVAGKKTIILLSTDGATYNGVLGIRDYNITGTGENQETQAFSTAAAGTSWKERIQGLKDQTYTFNGVYLSSDTNGQMAFRTSWVNDTALYLTILPDGTTGWEQQIKVSEFSQSGSVDGIAEVSISADGTGAVTAST